MEYRLRATAVVLHNNRILSFVGEDVTLSQQYRFLPGGAIEDNETAPACAERETREETGYQVIIDSKCVVDKDYCFHWMGKDYQCTTLFYKGTLVNPFQAKVTDANYNLGVEWVQLHELEEKFNYSPEILEAIKWILKVGFQVQIQ